MASRPPSSESPPRRQACLEVQALTKRYAGGALANDRLDLVIERGEVFGLLGPNGAGKTTLVKQIIGLVKPSSGEILIDGHDLVRDPAFGRRLCSYLPQGALPIESFRAHQAIELVGRLRGGRAALVRERTERLLAALELEEWRDELGFKLSGGVKRLVGFAMACVWPTRLVILDEPTNDVDPLRRRLLWRQIRSLSEEGVAVLLVTHNVLEAEQSVDRLAVIDRGRILDQGTPSSLKAAGENLLRLQINLVPGTAAPELPPFVRHHASLNRRLFLSLERADVLEAIRWAGAQVELGQAEEYALGAVTLEDAYIRLIGRDDALGSEDGGSG